MAPLGGHSNQDKSTQEVVNDLWLLVRDYAKQETVDPLKTIGKFLAWGVGGGLLVALGVLFGALAVLRALQEETGTHLTGNLNWVPYLVAFVFTAFATFLAIAAIKRPIRAEEKQKS